MKKLLTLVVCSLLAICTVSAKDIASGTFKNGGSWKITDQGELYVDAVTIPDYKITSKESGRYYVINIDNDIDGYYYDRWHTSAPWNSYMPQIKTLRLSSSVKTIGTEAFAHLNLLTKVTIEGSGIIIKDDAFSGCFRLYDFPFASGKITSIGSRAFVHCAFLTIELNGVTYIGYYAFDQCYRLWRRPQDQTNGNFSIKVTGAFPTVEVMSDYSSGVVKNEDFLATDGHTILTQTRTRVEKGSKLIVVSDTKSSGAFSSNGVGEVVMGGDGWRLKNGTLTITSDQLPYNSASDAPWYARRSYVTNLFINARNIPANLFMNYTALQTVNLPEDVISIGDNVFNGCTNLTKVVNLDKVKSIGAVAFSNTKLNVTILNSAQTIGNNAFDNVTTMSQLILGENLTSIGAYAFRNTLQSQAGHYWIKVAGAAPKSAAANAFDGVVTQKLFVPAGVYASYNGKSPWTQFNIETIVDFPVNGTNPSWELTWDGTLTILGSVPNYTNESDQPWFPYKNYIKKVVFGSNVTIVGNNALSYANENESKITEVVVPASVTSIGENAFKNNDQIEEVVAEGVKSIGSQAFENCSALEKVKFGKEVSSMGEKVFNNCGLVDVMAVKSATPPAITARTFEGLGRMSANAPAKVKAKYAARKATSATGQKSVSLEVPDEHISKYLAAQYWNLFTFEYIGEHGGIVESDQAYDGLYVLYSDGTMIISASAPTDPQNINTGFTISSSAKSKVKRVEIQGLLTKLGHQFNDCPNLEEVVLSGGINSLNGTFNNCPKLKSINLDNVQYLKSHQQGNKVIPCFGGCVALQEVNIPGVLEIGDNCFKGCTGLTKVALGGEAEVGMEAFSGCTALKRIALGNAKLNGALQAFQGCTALEEMTYSGTRMPAEIFKGCTALHKINLGGSLKDILSEAFANTSIDSIYVQCPTPPEAAANAFSGITLSSIKVIVPDAFDGPYSSAPVWEEMFTYEDEAYAELDFPIHFAIGNNGFGTVDESGNLTINAMGALVDNFRDYVEPYAPYIIGEIRIGNEVSSLPAGTPYRLPFGWVKEDGPRAIILGSGLLELGDYALYNNVWDCDLIVDCYALNPPVMKGANVFNWSKIQNGSQCVATLNVVNDAAVEAAYRADTYWKKFSISSVLTPADAPAECTVTFVDWDGTILQQTTTRPGMMVTPPADPVREGYTFKGWDSQEYNWVVSDLTITATYYDETYTVRFYDWDGTLLSEQQVHYGQAAEAPADPAREGYTFLGWSEDFSEVTIDKYIVAMYHNDHEGIEDIQPDQVPNIKVMIDGVIYILRDGKIYDILGTEVK